MVEQLPPGSALHRANNEGQQWTNVEALLWSIAHKLDWLDSRLMWTKRKKPKWPKWKQFPWDKDGVRIGDRGDATTEEVLAYHRSMSAKAGE
ncbi:hypothetical protein [Rhodococcus sp. ARP2]|uniref:hypothetical protein n=1 Tax=Rhodococcus sp. ARP2 TaxID=1661385 RepID=UPI00064BC968|nr:hypothetical protein [Rhodococcus sp. ARP2]